jgi:hypothetical protein
MPAAPAAVAAFLASEADREFRPVTIARRTAAIAAAHRAQDHPKWVRACARGSDASRGRGWCARVVAGVRAAKRRT